MRVRDCVLDDHKMTWKVHTDGKGARAAYHVNVAIQKTSLDSQPIFLTQTSVMKSNSSRNTTLITSVKLILIIIGGLPLRSLSPTSIDLRELSQ